MTRDLLGCSIDHQSRGTLVFWTSGIQVSQSRRPEAAVFVQYARDGNSPNTTI